MKALERALEKIEQGKKAPANTQRPAAPAPDAPYTPNANLRDDDRITVKPFPLEVFPERIRRIVEDCYTMLSYPRDFTAAGILAAAAIAIARTCKAVYQWEETACVYVAIVAPPGTAKSHPLTFALHPIIQANKQAIRDYNRAHKELTDGGDADPGALRDKQCLFGDFTIEALIKSASRNRRGISVYMDELFGFFQNFNRYNAGSEQEFWLSNWTGTPYAVTRMQRKYFLEWPAISILGTIQPSRLEELGKGGRSQNGFTERILFCYPDQVPIIRLRKRMERSDTRHILLKNYTAIINTLLDKQLELVGTDTEEEDKAWDIFFSPEADDYITDYINALKKEMEEKIENEYTLNVYSKMQTYAIRFALILNRLDYACACQDNTDFQPNDDQTITSDQVRKAAVLSEYFLQHALKAQNAISGATPVDKLPRDLQAYYRSLPRGEEITTAQLEEKALAFKGISRATLFRLLNEPNPERRIFSKLRHGVYERIY